MGRPELNQEQIDTFRARALEAAWRVFERGDENGGVEAVTMRAVARELGCSPMTAYRYFTNHEALINDLRAQAFDRFAASLRAAGEVESDELARLAAIGRAYVEFGLNQPQTYELMFG